MTPKEKALDLIKKHLTAIIEESLDGDKITFHIAKNCALATVDAILEARPGYPYALELGIKVQGLFDNMNFPYRYWEEVKEEIKKFDGKNE